MRRSWPRWKAPSDKPTGKVYAILQVLQWGLPIIMLSAKLLIIVVALELTLLLLRATLLLGDAACR